MEYNSPLGKIKEQHLLSLLQLPTSSDVLEVGCGNGKFLHQILEAYKVNVIGVDVDAQLIEQAQSYCVDNFAPDC
ncbi:class I SAM-dependent methyltransferase, partial [Pseudoalteromonas luteoviolacea]|uniref:class I SAM-dependent methyltransferase n=1 Tax=Pseudoalteromonas luteoviolacea TaxID=43657 RepID=UPI001F4426EE